MASETGPCHFPAPDRIGSAWSGTRSKSERPRSTGRSAMVIVVALRDLRERLKTRSMIAKIVRTREPPLRVERGLFWAVVGSLGAVDCRDGVHGRGSRSGPMDRIETLATSSWNPSNPSAMRCSDNAHPINLRRCSCGGAVCTRPGRKNIWQRRPPPRGKAAEGSPLTLWRRQFSAHPGKRIEGDRVTRG